MTTLPDVAGFGLIVWGIVCLLLLMLLTVLFLVAYSGLFEHVSVGAGPSPFQGNLQIAYKYVQGSYSNSGDEFTEIIQKAPVGSPAIGIYYDDPKQVPDGKTRYIVGVILGVGDADVGEETKSNMTQHGFKLFTIPNTEHCVKSSFTYKTQLSIYLAVKRVYPAMDAYIKEHRLCAHPMIEVYDNDRIQFLAPLSRQNDYYVPEVAPQLPDADVRDDSFDTDTSNNSNEEDSLVEEEEEDITTSPSDSLLSEPVTLSSTERSPETETETDTSSLSTAATESNVATSASEESTVSHDECGAGDAHTPSDSGSEPNSEQCASSSSFEDLAPEARQFEKSPSEISTEIEKDLEERIID